MNDSDKERAFGGVVMNEKQEVLLVEPTNHYGGYVWTFPKGRPNVGENDQETALREVLEEAGVSASIVAEIPGTFIGDTTINQYYLMTPQSGSSASDGECQNKCWADFETAKQMIQKTPNLNGRKRDLAILGAAFKLRI